MYLCCLGGWKRIICMADNVNHVVLKRFCIRRLCDVHDRQLIADFQ